MRKTVLAMLAGLLFVLTPTSAFAWGAEGHRLIMARALDSRASAPVPHSQLPPELKLFFEHFRDQVVLRANDPDLWRLVPWDDDANHFVDFGLPELGRPPFDELSRERGAALAKFSATTAHYLQPQRVRR